MNLQAFVNDNYDVLDISTGQTEIIQDFIFYTRDFRDTKLLHGKYVKVKL